MNFPFQIQLHVIRINRNILECKWKFRLDQVFQDLGINRNILECKLFFPPYMQGRSFVLIETYWNVNASAQSDLWSQSRVLIETYWNVNSNVRTVQSAVPSINRNILECKFCIRMGKGTGRNRINRNILECKCWSGRSIVYPGTWY